MKNAFTADGPQRWEAARREKIAKSEASQAKVSDSLFSKLWQWFRVEWKCLQDSDRREKPSPQSLW